MQRLSLILFRYELLPDNQSLSFLPDHKIPLSFLQKELLQSEGLHQLLRLCFINLIFIENKIFS